MWICAGDDEVHLCHQARLLEHLWVIVPDGIVVLSSAGNIQRSWPEPQRQGVAGGGEAAPPSNGTEHSWHEPAAVAGTQTEGEMSQQWVLLRAVVSSAVTVMALKGPGDDCNALRGKRC